MCMGLVPMWAIVLIFICFIFGAILGAAIGGLLSRRPPSHRPSNPIADGVDRTAYAQFTVLLMDLGN